MNEADNTFRILKEEPLLVTSRWCRFGIHTWQKWREPNKGTTYVDFYQARYCDSCGLFNRRKLNLYLR